MKNLKFVLVGVFAAACGGGGGGDDEADARRTDGIVLADGSGPGADGTPPVGCDVANPYAAPITEPSATFVANYDDNGDTAGDPIANNDLMTFGGLGTAGPPADLFFIDLYEGYGMFAGEGGAVVDFTAFTVPLAIDFAASPMETNFQSCGACVVLYNGVTVSGGQITGIGAILLAQSGTLNITALPTAAGQPFTATLTNVTLAELDDEGAPVAAGCTTNIATLDVTATAEAPAPAKPGALRLRPSFKLVD